MNRNASIMLDKLDIQKQLSIDRAVLTDYDVVQSVLAGNKPLFELLMRRYNNRLFRIARGILRDDDEAMDIVQDSWIKIYTKLEQFRGPKGFGVWASVVARNISLMRLRKLSVSIQLESIDDKYLNEQKSVLANEPLKGLAKQQLDALIIAAVDDLPEKYRLVFILRAAENLSSKETSDTLGITVDAVKQRYSRAKKLMKNQLEMHMVEAELNLFEFAGHRCDEVVSEVLKRILV